MKLLNTHGPAISIAGTIGTILVIGLVNPAMSQIAVQGSINGSPDDGMICRAGYGGEFKDGNLKCSKSRFFFVELSCDDSKYPTYVVRPAGSPGTTNGRDICTRKSGVRISSTDDVGQLTLGQEYEFAKVDTAAVATGTARLDQEEAAALALNATKDVDSIAGEPEIQAHPETGAKDRAVVHVTHFTHAVPAGRPTAAGRASSMRP